MQPFPTDHGSEWERRVESRTRWPLLKATFACWLALYRNGPPTTRREASLRSSARSLDRSCHTDLRGTVPPRNSDTSSLPVHRRHRLEARNLNRQNMESRIDRGYVATNAQFQTCYRASRDLE